MPSIYLIRHGQASFGKSNYDALSPLGQQQALWLGDYFSESKLNASRLVRGDLVRHAQTAEGILKQFNAPLTSSVTSAWNEFDFETLLKLFLTKYPSEMPSAPGPKVFFGVLRKAIHEWSQDQIASEHIETWQQFHDRVQTGLEDLAKPARDQSSLVVTSGGAIAMALSQVLGLDVERMIDLNMQTRNTSVTELYLGSNKLHLVSFNAIPHLESEDRKSSITSV